MAPVACSDAFSLTEPASTSLENALEPARSAHWTALARKGRGRALKYKPLNTSLGTQKGGDHGGFVRFCGGWRRFRRLRGRRPSSEEPGTSVALLEAGGANDNWVVTTPGAMILMISGKAGRADFGRSPHRQKAAIQP
jgi:hypothetical protein